MPGFAIVQGMGKPTSRDRLMKDLAQLTRALSDCEAGRLAGMLEGESDEIKALLKRRLSDVQAKLASSAGGPPVADIPQPE